MIKEEFEKEACSRGYAPNIGLVRKYTKLHKKDFYTEADLIDYYRYFDKRSKTFPGIAKAMAEQWG